MINLNPTGNLCIASNEAAGCCTICSLSSWQGPRLGVLAPITGGPTGAPRGPSGHARHPETLFPELPRWNWKRRGTSKAPARMRGKVDGRARPSGIGAAARRSPWRRPGLPLRGWPRPGLPRQASAAQAATSIQRIDYHQTLTYWSGVDGCAPWS
jgi:hypothetical protein